MFCLNGEPMVLPGQHKLMPLPYPYGALEPVLSAGSVRLHHDILQQKYVDGLNSAELKLAEARIKNDFDLIRYWENELAFNGSAVSTLSARSFPPRPTKSRARAGLSLRGSPRGRGWRFCRRKSTRTERSGAASRFWCSMCGSMRIIRITTQSATNTLKSGGSS